MIIFKTFNEEAIVIIVPSGVWKPCLGLQDAQQSLLFTDFTLVAHLRDFLAIHVACSEVKVAILLDS